MMFYQSSRCERLDISNDMFPEATLYIQQLNISVRPKLTGQQMLGELFACETKNPDGGNGGGPKTS